MRIPLIAGNWKMNTSREQAVELARGVADGAAGMPVELVVCPPFVWLEAVATALAGSVVSLGAQNVCADPDGAFTGEVSAAMLNSCGCRYVILGHSERRQLMGETDASVNRKLVAAHRAGLVPIVCVGETLQQREAGQTGTVVRGQLAGSLAGLSATQMEGTVIAYEPVWAIGTGKNATPAEAQAVHADLRNWLRSHYNSEVAEAVLILYGGSVKPDNAASLLGQPDIDGALVGGASLKADGFLGIAGAAKRPAAETG